MSMLKATVSCYYPDYNKEERSSSKSFSDNTELAYENIDDNREKYRVD